MKKGTALRIILILALIFGVVCSGYAQRKKKRGKDELPPIVRMTSIQFADGLREFYTLNYQEAERIFRNIINDDSKNDPAYFMLAKLKKEQKEYHQAIEYIKKAIQANPENIWYEQLLAELYGEIQDYKNSAVSWEKVCKKVDNNEYYLFELAHAYVRLNRMKDAIKTYDRMEEILGPNDELTRIKSELWLYLNQMDQAVHEYEKLLDIFPSEVQYYIAIGNIYLSNGMNEKALIAYKKGEETAPNDASLALALYEYYQLHPDQNAKEGSLDKLIRSDIEPEVIEKIIIKESLDAKKSKNKDLIQKQIGYAELFLSKHPESYRVWDQLTHLYMIDQQEEKAFQTAQMAIQNHSLASETWYIFVSTAFNLKKQDQILAHKTDIEELFPTQLPILYILGKTLIEDNQIKEGIDILQYCITYTVDNSWAQELHEIVGDAYFKLGNKAEALKNWQSSKKKGNKSEEIEKKINSVK